MGSGGTLVSFSKLIIGRSNQFDNRGDISFAVGHNGPGGCRYGLYQS